MVQSLEDVARSLNLPIQDPKDYPLDCYVKANPKDLLDIVKKLKNDFGVFHLSVIIAFDAEDGYRLFYPFSVILDNGEWGKLILDISLDKKNPEIDSLTPEIPGAILYEREAYDMLGIRFKNLKDHRRLLSADTMPPDLFPLKKEHTYQEIRDRLAEEAAKRSEELK